MNPKLSQATEKELITRLHLLQLSSVKKIKTIVIQQDDSANNPREEHDNACTMFCKHGRYNLGDKDAEDPIKTVLIYDLNGDGYEVDEDEMQNITDMANEWCRGLDRSDADYARAATLYYWLLGQEGESIEEREEQRLRSDVAVIQPLYLYDHSGITISTGAFSCPWDSGQVGWIYVTKDKLAEEFNGDVALAEARITSEVEEYDQYLTGDVYGYTIYEHEEFDQDGIVIPPTDGEVVDSCWGFYGSDPFENGMSEHIDSELHEQLKSVEVTY